MRRNKKKKSNYICRPPYDYTQLYIFPEIDTHTHLKKKMCWRDNNNNKDPFSKWMNMLDGHFDGTLLSGNRMLEGTSRVNERTKERERDDNNNSKWSESLSYSLVLWYPIVGHRELATTTPTESCTHINYSQSDRQTESRVLGAPLVVVVFIINK